MTAAARAGCACRSSLLRGTMADSGSRREITRRRSWPAILRRRWRRSVWIINNNCMRTKIFLSSTARQPWNCTATFLRLSADKFIASQCYAMCHDLVMRRGQAMTECVMRWRHAPPVTCLHSVKKRKIYYSQKRKINRIYVLTTKESRESLKIMFK